MIKTLFGFQFNIDSYSNNLDYLIRLIKMKTSKYVCFANAHMIVEAVKDKQFAAVLHNSDALFMDGMSLVFANRLLNNDKNSFRFAGMDVIHDLIQRSEDASFSVFFYGSTEDNLKKLVNYLEIHFPKLKIAGMISPPYRSLTDFEIKEYVEFINQAKADILFVSLGCPKQEIWMHEMKNKIQCVMFGVGNAFLTISGQERRSPEWMQKMGLEWVFRLILEPKRLWKRYLITNTYFIYLFFKYKIFNLNHE
jgi:N-acetylglucosaminyldiphosphoundecaprenol N-acetyl-beta-D-mannosaminyltransferase